MNFKILVTRDEPSTGELIFRRFAMQRTEKRANGKNLFLHGIQDARSSK